MPLSIVGYEAVLFYTLRDLGYTDDGALNFISGPAYLPWQLMGNIDSYFSLTIKAYVDKRLELGKKIIDRELELGMTPIQQGCSGQVPSTIPSRASAHERIQCPLMVRVPRNISDRPASTKTSENSAWLCLKSSASSSARTTIMPATRSTRTSPQ